jgi:hypothetical protein
MSDWDKYPRTPGGNNRGVLRQRKARRRLEAGARNAASDAQQRDCGHIHGFAVGCHGRVSA